MGNELKKEFHYFILTDYEQEEEYLREKHKSGYCLEKVTLPGIYHFRKCDPEDVVYKLDFNPKKEAERESYLQLYKDYGWEYMQDLNEYSYFRKLAENCSQEDLDIFSDNASRMEMLKKIFLKRMIPLLVIFLTCILPQLIRLIYVGVTQQWIMDGWTAGGLTFYGIVFVLYVIILSKCLFGFWKLREKYKTS